MATMILSPYNGSVYDALGGVKDTADKVNLDQIRGVGKLLRDFHYENDLCVAIAHRHFDLDKNEAMLEVDQGHTIVTKPVKVEDLPDLGAMPTTIVVGKDGKWYPVEYGLGEAAVLRASTDAAFLQKVADYLVENGLEIKIGLTARKEPTHLEPDECLVEESYQDTRTSEVRRCKKADVKAQHVAARFGFSNKLEGQVEWECDEKCQGTGCDNDTEGDSTTEARTDAYLVEAHFDFSKNPEGEIEQCCGSK